MLNKCVYAKKKKKLSCRRPLCPSHLPMLVSCRLASCRLGGPCCPVLSEVLQCSSKLTHLDLSINVLQDEGLRVLCAALGCPSCHLQSLW